VHNHGYMAKSGKKSYMDVKPRKRRQNVSAKTDDTIAFPDSSFLEPSPVKPKLTGSKSLRPNWLKRHVGLISIIVVIVIVSLIATRSQPLQLSANSTPTISTKKAVAQTTSKTKTGPTTVKPAITSATSAEQVGIWFSTYGSIANAMRSDYSSLTVDDSTTNENISAVGVDCKQVFKDAQTAQSAPVIPDTSMQKIWASALTSYSAGAQNCIEGVNEADVNLITQGNSEIAQGTASLNLVTQSIEQLAQQH
jgi:hypothetical protein